MPENEKKITREELLEIIDWTPRAEREGLDLSDKGITELPDEIDQLTIPQTLYLSHNQLTTLPESIGQLTNLQTLYLNHNQLTTLPESIGQLTNLQTLYLNANQLTTLPESIGQLINLQTLYLNANQLTTLPESIGQLINLQKLYLNANKLTALPKSIGLLINLKMLRLTDNQLTALPESVGQFANLQKLYLQINQLTMLPESIGQLANLLVLYLTANQLTTLPESISQLAKLQTLSINNNQLMRLPKSIGQLTSLQKLNVCDNPLTSLPVSIGELADLESLDIVGCQIALLPASVGKLASIWDLALLENQLTSLPESIGQLANLRKILLHKNKLRTLPTSLARLEKLENLTLDDNPLNPALKSAYEAGIPTLFAYLRSLEEDAEPLYEAKLVLVGEGGVGKTTLLKAMTGQEPRADEPTTHGVKINVQALHLPHPDEHGVQIQLNAWDFGGQEVYRVTHQFFFSRRSIYLLLWEPRAGVQQCQVEDWLKMIRLRVGDDARVIIVSTHCKTGQRIARIDQPTFRRDYGDMIVGFHEVDSLVDDTSTREKVGVAELKGMIASVAKDLEQMGMLLNRDWRETRNELIDLGQRVPRLSYAEVGKVCARNSLDEISTRTLVTLMHDLGHVVHYSDDERLRDDVVLQPEWLTKAIGFVLEDRATQEMDGILPDERLREIWYEKPVDGKTRFQPRLYPFFLQLMEKYDVSYRLEAGDASLVAQHVPQVRPDLPWLPEDDDPKPNHRRIAMVCAMDENPPGLVPWMIIRTHEYAYQRHSDAHRLHWQKGMFLRNKSHGEAMLELRGREFHLYAEAIWPEYFMNVLRQTLQKLITDNWPGLEGRYAFTVPCRERQNGKACDGRFRIDALHQFLQEGDVTIRCQECRQRQDIVKLLYGFEETDTRAQLDRIETKVSRGFVDMGEQLVALKSQIADSLMATLRAISAESKDGPRLFDIEPAGGNWRRPFAERYHIRLWCEAEGCHHRVREAGKGVYEVTATREWVTRIAPYANFVAGVLKMVLPMVAPAVNVRFGPNTMDESGLKNHLDLVKTATEKLAPNVQVRDPSLLRKGGILTPAERSGILALHAFLRETDPTHERLGLTRIPTYTGDYLWLCREHYLESLSKIPDKIE